MTLMKRVFPFCSGTILTIMAGIGWQTPAFANDTSVLCSNRNMMTEVALSTPEFYAAFCSTGYYEEEPGCYVPTEYYYIGQSRKTGATIFLSDASWSVENNVRTYTAHNGEYSYKISTSGAYNFPAWRSLSVLENGWSIYHHYVDGYFGYWDC